MNRQEKIQDVIRLLKKLGVEKLQSTIALEKMPEDQLDELVKNLKKLLDKHDI